MNRIIIDNRTELTDTQALRIVLRVVEIGRIQAECRDYFTVVEVAGSDYAVAYHRNLKSERFSIWPHNDVVQ